MKLKKILSLFFLICLMFQMAQISHAAAFNNEIDKIISQSDFELKSTVSIYAKENNKLLYKKNEHKLLNPASVLKVLTFGASYFTLGSDYKFETSVYKYNNDLYIKLGADPLLTSEDLIVLFDEVKTKFKKENLNNIYIDDSIIDKDPYPACWMEEDVFPYQRSITPYIIDNNFIDIAIKRSSLATSIDIIQNDLYRIPIINELKLGDREKLSANNYKIQKMYDEKSGVISLSGVIVKDEILKLPVLKPEINFDIKLRNALKKTEIEYLNKIKVKEVPANALKIASVGHKIDEVAKNILLNSDNFSSEVVFKAAAAKYINYTYSATLEDAINMYYSVLPDTKDYGIKITDGSGVGRKNLLSTKYIVESMEKLFRNKNFKNLLATANQGTLSDRLVFLEGNLKAKTGTLANMSSIAGVLTSKKGKDIVFAVITQNSPKRPAVLKHFENNVVTALYRRY